MSASPPPVIANFDGRSVQLDGNVIYLSVGGSGPPLLLLHGFPETHLMWRDIAPRLPARFTVVCADLRGYGASGCPPSTPDHAPYSKQTMANEMVALMRRLGFKRFSVAGHDRGVALHTAWPSTIRTSSKRSRCSTSFRSQQLGTWPTIASR